jgi:hypothetical protein
MTSETLDIAKSKNTNETETRSNAESLAIHVVREGVLEERLLYSMMRRMVSEEMYCHFPFVQSPYPLWLNKNILTARVAKCAKKTTKLCRVNICT